MQVHLVRQVHRWALEDGRLNCRTLCLQQSEKRGQGKNKSRI
jgi:hypothetical protein